MVCSQVTKKGIHPTNFDFAALGVSLEGKYRSVWCSAARVRSARIEASWKTCWCGIEVEVIKKRKGRELDFGIGITLSIFSLVDVMITHNIGEV